MAMPSCNKSFKHHHLSPFEAGSTFEHHEHADHAPLPSSTASSAPFAASLASAKHSPAEDSVLHSLSNSSRPTHGALHFNPGHPHAPPNFQFFQQLKQNKFVLNCALLVSLGGIMFGYDQGVISVILVLKQFTSRFDQIDESYAGLGSPSFWRGFLTAMVELGAVVGVLQAGFVADKYGRKSAIRSGAVLFILGSILQTVSFEFVTLVVGRFIAGIGVGILSMTAPMYMSEISPSNIRGALLCLEEFNIVFGIVVAFYFTYGTRFIHGEAAWRLPFGIQVLPAFILLFGLSRLPSSPSWLAAKGRHQECLDALVLLRQLPPEDASVRAEWTEIRVDAEFQRQCTSAASGGPPRGRFAATKSEAKKWSGLFRAGCWRRTLVGVGLTFFQQFLGVNALIYYSPILFETLGLDFEMRLHMSGVMNVCQMIGTSLSFFLIDKFGRKSLLLFGSSIVFACHAIVAIILAKYGADWDHHRDAGWAGVTFIMLFMLVFGVSWGPVPWVMPSEVFPASLRAKGVAISSFSTWMSNFIIGLITPVMVAFSPSGAFAFFAAFSILSFVFVWFLVPETANVPLEAMDQVFGDRLGLEDNHKKQQIYQAISAEP